MNRLDRASLLLALTEKLRQKGSWGGETHLQKATYVLQRVLGVPFDYRFMLYKYGPFSFDLRDEMSALRGEGFLEWEVRSDRYGPSLKSGPLGEALKQQFSAMPDRYKRQVDFVAARLGNKKVAGLERLATAIFVTLDEGCPAADRTSRINQLKPHVSLPEASVAVEEADGFIREAAETAAESMPE